MLLTGVGGPFAGGITVPASLGTGTFSQVSQSSGTTTIAGAITAGKVVIVAVSLNTSNSVTPTAVSDGTNSYTKAIEADNANTNVSIWYKTNASAVSASWTLTVTFSGDGGGGVCAFSAAVAQYGGATTVDVTNTNTAASGTTLTVATGTLGQAVEIIFGTGAAAGVVASYSATSPFTNINSVTGSAATFPVIGLDYDIVASTGSVTYTETISSSGSRLCAAVASFK